MSSRQQYSIEDLLKKAYAHTNDHRPLAKAPTAETSATSVRSTPNAAAASKFGHILEWLNREMIPFNPEALSKRFSDFPLDFQLASMIAARSHPKDQCQEFFFCTHHLLSLALKFAN